MDYGEAGQKLSQVLYADPSTWNIKVSKISNGYILYRYPKEPTYFPDATDVLHEISRMITGEPITLPVSPEEAGLLKPDENQLELDEEWPLVAAATVQDVADMLGQYRGKYSHFPTFAIQNTIESVFTGHGFLNYNDYLRCRYELTPTKLQRIFESLVALPPPGQLHREEKYAGQYNTKEGIRHD